MLVILELLMGGCFFGVIQGSYALKTSVNLHNRHPLNMGKRASAFDMNTPAESENNFTLYLCYSISEKNDENAAKIWIDGGTHGREWITPATVTFLIQRLMFKWDEQPDYIRNKTWYFMPMVNPDGYVFSRRFDRLWRKNRASTKNPQCKGVDINRNFNVGWNTVGSASDPCKLNFHGPAPCSENETQSVVAFLKGRTNVGAFLTFHSYNQALAYPYGHTYVMHARAAEMQALGNDVVQKIKQRTGKIYRVGQRFKLLRPAGGGADDWAGATLNAKYVYTVELRDRGTYGFLLPPSQIIPTGIESYILVEAVAKAV